MSEKKKGFITLLLLALAVTALVFVTRNIKPKDNTKIIDTVVVDSNAVDTSAADSAGNFVINDSLINKK